MTDFFEKSQENEAQFREQSIAIQRAKNKPLKAVTNCLYCNERITIGRYCSAECREDGEMEASIRSKQFR